MFSKLWGSICFCWWEWEARMAVGAIASSSFHCGSLALVRIQYSTFTAVITCLHWVRVNFLFSLSIPCCLSFLQHFLQYWDNSLCDVNLSRWTLGFALRRHHHYVDMLTSYQWHGHPTKVHGPFHACPHSWIYWKLLPPTYFPGPWEGIPSQEEW